MLARILEAAGLATVGITLTRVHTERVRPPRYLFGAFPFGRALGKPNDPAFQQQVIDAALSLLSRPESDKPILEDFPVLLDEEPMTEEDELLVCALVVPPRKAGTDGKQEWAKEVATEIAALRPFYEESHCKLGRTMLGASQIPPEQIEQAATYLARFVAGEDFTPAERPEGTRPIQYLRWCADDLKVFYQEAAIARQGDQPWTNRQLQDWLWRGTALGALIVTMRARIQQIGDQVDKAVAFGLIPRNYP